MIGTTTFEVGVSRPLFVTRIPPLVAPWRTNYAVSSDGQRFLINSVGAGGGARRHHDRRELAAEMRKKYELVFGNEEATRRDK
jgi:hypothetical protein